MRPVLFALSVVLTTAPAFAFGTVVDLPNLTWPQDAQTSTSTKGCETISQPATVECK